MLIVARIMIDKNLKKYFYIVTCLYISIFILSIISVLFIDNIHGTISSEELRMSSINITITSSLLALLPRNILISFLIMLSGLLGYELIPLFMLAYNAYDFGQIIAMINKPETINMVYVFLPHCLIEMPTLFLCTTFACNFALYMRMQYGGIINIIKSKENINPVFMKYLIKPYFFYILPLVVLGCIIESTISLHIMRLLFNGGF
jgi:uncharacterized membrane protein SpoIIM required for sporulation